MKYYEISEDLGVDFKLRTFEKNQNSKSNSQQILDALSEDNITQFKKLVPKEIHILFNNFKDALKDVK